MEEAAASRRRRPRGMEMASLVSPLWSRLLGPASLVLPLWFLLFGPTSLVPCSSVPPLLSFLCFPWLQPKPRYILSMLYVCACCACVLCAVCMLCAMQCDVSVDVSGANTHTGDVAIVNGEQRDIPRQ